LVFEQALTNASATDIQLTTPFRTKDRRGDLIRAAKTPRGEYVLMAVGRNPTGITSVVVAPSPGVELTPADLKGIWNAAVSAVKEVVTAVGEFIGGGSSGSNGGNSGDNNITINVKDNKGTVTVNCNGNTQHQQ